ncbi:nickel-responsive transcriptional regulator NikR [Paenibacillus sp. GCM10012303]|uniref:nickel-responsive transcriptional regulator NikR n=1 Tax=Paenibacillus sp. GCM10012303 TaxID=3317340 RepID=UPI00361EFC11
MADKDELVRFGVSMPSELIQQFDQYTAEQGYTNRSEAIRDLVRKALLQPGRLLPEQIVAGTIVMVYDHDVRELPLLLMDLQHRFHRQIISNMHIHMNRDQCLEIIAVRGLLAKLRELHAQIQVQRGVLYCELSVTYVDGQEPGDGGHSHHHHDHDHDHDHDHHDHHHHHHQHNHHDHHAPDNRDHSGTHSPAGEHEHPPGQGTSES